MKKTLQLGFFLLSAVTVSAQSSPPTADFKPQQSPFYKYITDTINFTPYASGTEITNQYIQEGALFSGVGTGAPQIYDYGVGSWGQVLISPTWYDPIRVDFVDTLTGLTTTLVQQIEFENPINTEIDYIKVDVYDASDNLLQTYTSTSPEYVTIDLGSPLAAYMILDDDQGTAYVVDNILLDFGNAGAGINILKNEQLHVYPNPASDELTITVPESMLFSDYIIVDQAGRTVMQGILSTLSSKLSIGTLEKGMYYLKTLSGVCTKLIKQ